MKTGEQPLFGVRPETEGVCIAFGVLPLLPALRHAHRPVNLVRDPDASGPGDIPQPLVSLRAPLSSPSRGQRNSSMLHPRYSRMIV